MAQREIQVFNAVQRLVHWLHVVAFTVLALTGFVLYAPVQSLAMGYAGWTLRLLHRIAAILLALVPLIYLIFSPRRLFDSLKRIFTWTKEDVGWFKAFPRYYFLGDEEAMPPQDKFNAGQKMFYIVTAVCLLLFGVTGFLMWFGKFAIPTWLFLWSVFIHDLCFIAYVCFFFIHFALCAVHPLMRGSLNGMLFGWLPEEYIKHHHARYYEELVSEKK
ncbi:MAG TPA: hypothetical protein ENL34_10310 [Chloroflexi bacterium]|nr:hypothetical protein [Chloroflexota bacterium]